LFMTDQIDLQGAACPVPLQHNEQIVLGHGSGGRMSHDLIRNIFLSAFDNPVLMAGDDAASIRHPFLNGMVISTDSHVVWPLFFPGGDIGRLAVCGTVNDVAMLGARPRYLTAGFILEEGLSLKILKQVVDSMKIAAAEAGIQIIAGDTKVVQKGKADLLYITTSGVGEPIGSAKIFGANAQPGDKVIISGTIGDHGIAVLTARGELGISNEIRSDVAPLNHLVELLVNGCPGVHVLRDPTRGGLATTLNEIARQSNVCIQIEERVIPVNPAVAATSEMLGFDPLYIANEGKMVVIVAAEQANRALEIIRNSPLGKDAALIGDVLQKPPKKVLLRTEIGTNRILDMLAGEMLPRIC
jgi:hydrogenase expression/formation protein HypE